MEAEYIAMRSTVCRTLIPLRDLLKEVARALNVRNKDVMSMHTKQANAERDETREQINVDYEIYVIQAGCPTCLEKKRFGSIRRAQRDPAND
jgi:hypothetical protein